MEQPVLIAGDDGVPIRVREELAAAGVPTVSICSTKRAQAALAAKAAGARVVVGELDEPATWEEAGLPSARAVGVLGPSDLENLGAALLVADQVKSIPIVVRLFSRDLGAGVERMLGSRGTALSEIEVAGPLLVQAAVSGVSGQRVTIAGRVLEVAEVDKDDPALVVALCDADDPANLLPPRAQIEHTALALIDPQSVVQGARGALPEAVARHHRTTPARPRRNAARLATIPKRATLLLAAIVIVFTTSVAVFATSKHLGLVDAIYFTATTMATVGYGDVNLAHAPDWLKLYDVALMAASAVLLASVLAFLTDALVSTRIDRALARFPRPKADHVIVCGLGKAGARVLQGLHDLQVPCVGVERAPDAVGVGVARRLEIPVAFADARAPGTLESVNVKHARALMAVTSDDLANLETALIARRHNPHLRVVMRIFDPKLAERLDRGIELDITRSMSALAAPVFAAALLGRPLAQPLSLPNVPLRVIETALPQNSALAGRTIKEIHAQRELRVLSAGGAWRPRDDIVLTPGTRLSVIATQGASDDLLDTPQSMPACPPSPPPSRSPH
jgi:Trk K+ transport system NAD-binding subunit